MIILEENLFENAITKNQVKFLVLLKNENFNAGRVRLRKTGWIVPDTSVKERRLLFSDDTPQDEMKKEAAAFDASRTLATE